MNREIQLLVEKYSLMPTYQHLVEAVEGIQQFYPYSDEILTALYQENWLRLYQLRRDLESVAGAIILRHLYTDLQREHTHRAPKWLSSEAAGSSTLVIRNSILRSLSRSGDSGFVLQQLQNYYNECNLTRARDLETELIQGIYTLAEIPQSPEPQIYAFLHQILQSDEIQLIHATAHVLGIIGIESDLIVMRERLERSRNLQGTPISVLDAMITIGGDSAADQLLELLNKCNLVFSGSQEIPINLMLLPYLIRNLALLLGPSNSEPHSQDLSRIHQFRNLIAETSRINRNYSSWVQVNSQTDEEIQHVLRWLVDPVFPYQAGNQQYDNFRRRKFGYRGSASIQSTKEVLTLATNKIGWSAPQADESLQSWMNRVLVEMKLDYMIPGSPAWGAAQSQLQNVVSNARARDVYNCCQEIYYLSVSPANPDDDNEDED